MNLTLKALSISILCAISVFGLAYATESDIENHCNNLCTQNNNCGSDTYNCMTSCIDKTTDYGSSATSKCADLDL
jgi:hypothetical protein